MPTPIFFLEPLLAQAASPKVVKPKISVPPPSSPPDDPNPHQVWLLAATGGLFLLLLVLAIKSHLIVKELERTIRIEKLKNKEIHKRLRLAAESITKMEKNPDLLHSRDFNLDYLRLRMAEELFNNAIVSQIKVRVKDKISAALSPTQSGAGASVGIASTGRQVDAMFDVEYEPGGEAPKGTKRVLFRIQIKLLKLPTQPTSATISQIIDCLETYLSPSDEHDTWQPVLQGRIAQISWDQKAKPTPLLVLEQSQDGSNVTFRTGRAVAKR